MSINPVTWDMNVCHTYYHVAPDQANQGQGIYEGPNPPPPQSLPPPGLICRRLLACAGACGFRGPARAARGIGASESDDDNADAHHDRQREGHQQKTDDVFLHR